MTALYIAVVVLCVLAVLWLLKRIGFALVKRWLDRHVAKTNACEFCFVQRRAYLIKSADDGPPMAMCEACVDSKRFRIGLEMMLKSGRAVRVEAQS